MSDQAVPAGRACPVCGWLMFTVPVHHGNGRTTTWTVCHQGHSDRARAVQPQPLTIVRSSNA